MIKKSLLHAEYTCKLIKKFLINKNYTYKELKYESKCIFNKIKYKS